MARTAGPDPRAPFDDTAFRLPDLRCCVLCATPCASASLAAQGRCVQLVSTDTLGDSCLVLFYADSLALRLCFDPTLYGRDPDLHGALTRGGAEGTGSKSDSVMRRGLDRRHAGRDRCRDEELVSAGVRG